MSRQATAETKVSPLAAPAAGLRRSKSLAWLPIPGLLLTFAVLGATQPRGAFESPHLLLVLNFVFSTLASFFVAYLVSRSFLVKGSPGLLLLGCGALVWGASVVGIVAAQENTNRMVTIYNLCAWLSALCHLAGVVLSSRRGPAVQAPSFWLVLGYGLALGAVVILTLATQAGWMPVFFVPGRGGTPVRQLVLGGAVGMFATTALLLWAAERRPCSPFTYWYRLALALIATGLLGVMVQDTMGGWLNWAGRATQYLGGIYMLVAAVSSVREARAVGLSLEAALSESEERFRVAQELSLDAFTILNAVRDTDGKIVDFRWVYLNPAAGRILRRRPEELAGQRLLEVLPGNKSNSDLFARYVRVVESGQAHDYELHYQAEGMDAWFRNMTVRLGDGIAVCFTDITERKRAEAALRESEERLQEALRVSHSFAFEWEPESDRVRRSHSCAGLLGLTGEEITEDTGRGFFQRVHPEDRERFVGMLASLKPGAERYETKYRILRPDGGTTVVEESARAFFDSRGRLCRLIGVTTDVTAREQAEEALRGSLREKEVLLREIHHRVKNNLQVICSLVDLQTDALADPTWSGVLTDMRDRVRSMALVHEKLYQSESLANVEFGEYARSLLDTLWRAHAGAGSRIRLKLELEPVSLSIVTAVPCGLLLNELVSNALKHAFRGRAEGEVRVGLSTGPEGRIWLRVSDDGAGLPEGLDWSRSRSLGLRLVQMLVRQLEGELEVKTGAGTAFQVSFMTSQPKASAGGKHE